MIMIWICTVIARAHNCLLLLCELVMNAFWNSIIRGNEKIHERKKKNRETHLETVPASR